MTVPSIKRLPAACPSLRFPCHLPLLRFMLETEVTEDKYKQTKTSYRLESREKDGNIRIAAFLREALEVRQAGTCWTCCLQGASSDHPGPKHTHTSVYVIMSLAPTSPLLSSQPLLFLRQTTIPLLSRPSLTFPHSGLPLTADRTDRPGSLSLHASTVGLRDNSTSGRGR